MKMVFEKFESSLDLEKGTVNVLQIEDKEIFSQCVYSVVNFFPDSCPEPAFFFSGEKEVKAKDALYIVGDLLSYDFNNRTIVTQALKHVTQMVVEDEVSRSLANQLNENILEIITNLLDQMNANYDLADDWDSQKYLKAMGFCIDESGVAGVFDKAILLLGVIADLMPDVILVFVNLMTYLSDEQCHEFCNQVKALELTVLTYEIGSTIIPEYFDNGLYVDANYLESSLLLS